MIGSIYFYVTNGPYLFLSFIIKTYSRLTFFGAYFLPKKARARYYELVKQDTIEQMVSMGLIK
jgi:hypothetical protein